MGVETNGANILNTFNMKEHFDGLFFAKKKSTVTEVTLGKDLTSLELVIACNLDKVTVGSKVLINYNNAVMSAVVADKYTIQGDPFIILFIEFDGFKAFEIHTYHNDVVLVATHMVNYVSTDTVNDILKKLYGATPHYVFDDVVL